MLSRIKNIFKTKFGKDIAITIIGQVVVLIVAFGLNKLISTRLGTTGFGEYSLTIKTAGVLTYIMLACLGIAIPKYLATYREIGDKVKEARYVISGLLIMYILSLLTIGLIFIFKVPFAKIIFGENGYEHYILPILLFAFSSALATFTFSYYRGLDKFYRFSIAQITLQLITLIIAFIVSNDIVTLFYVWSIATGSYGTFVCVRAFMKYYPNAEISSFKKDLKPYMFELARFCFPRIPGEFFLFSYIVVPLIIINNRLGTEITAYFAAATAINSMVSPLFSFVGLVLLPLVSKSIANHNYSDADRKVVMLGKIYLIIGTLAIIFILLFAPLVINILFTADFQSSSTIVRIMIFAILPNAFYLLLRNPLDAMSKIPYNTINLGISFIFLNISILLSTSITAYALSFVFAYGILSALTFLSWYKCRKKYLLNTDKEINTEIKI